MSGKLCQVKLVLYATNLTSGHMSALGCLISQVKRIRSFFFMMIVEIVLAHLTASVRLRLSSRNIWWIFPDSISTFAENLLEGGNSPILTFIGLLGGGLTPEDFNILNSIRRRGKCAWLPLLCSPHKSENHGLQQTRSPSPPPCCCSASDWWAWRSSAAGGSRNKQPGFKPKGARRNSPAPFFFFGIGF